LVLAEVFQRNVIEIGKTPPRAGQYLLSATYMPPKDQRWCPCCEQYLSRRKVQEHLRIFRQPPDAEPSSSVSTPFFIPPIASAAADDVSSESNSHQSGTASPERGLAPEAEFPTDPFECPDISTDSLDVTAGDFLSEGDPVPFTSSSPPPPFDDCDLARPSLSLANVRPQVLWDFDDSEAGDTEGEESIGGDDSDEADEADDGTTWDWAKLFGDGHSADKDLEEAKLQFGVEWDREAAMLGMCFFLSIRLILLII
jgi:hypothetical protein